MLDQSWRAKMASSSRGLWLLVAVTVMLTLTGCAPSYMRAGALQPAPSPGKVLINFVRPSFYGAGQTMLLWHDATFIGNLEAGEIVQYEVEPGEHVFMVSGYGWGFVKAEVIADRIYFLKGNIDFVGINTLGVADAPNDERVGVWLKLRPMIIDPQKVATQDPLDEAEAVKMLAEYHAGKHRYPLLLPAHGIASGDAH